VGRTTIAAMQCVEKGLLHLDEDVTSILPELKGREILKGFEEGTQKPILVPNSKKITLRSVCG
jgi:CubicO group peptidase (beta-lactamase class C family)